MARHKFNNDTLVLGSGSCLGITERSFTWLDCLTLHPYICQTVATTHTNKIKTIPQPALVLTLDNLTKPHMGENSLVAFDAQMVPNTLLKQSAYFLGVWDSFIDIKLEKEMVLKGGVTISMWISVTSFSEKNSVLADSKESKTDKSFTVFLNPDSLKIKICTLSTSCELFEAEAKVKEKTWTFLAFSVNFDENTGGVYINEIHEPMKTGTVQLNKWFTSDKLKGSIRIGSERFQYINGSNNFHGKMSCFQIFPSFLTVAQVNHVMKNCYLDNEHPQSELCPQGYFPIKDFCYNLSNSSMNYSMAEMTCIRENRRVAYPHNYLIQEMLLIYAQKFDVNDIWIGLDSMSGISIPTVKLSYS